MRRRRRRRISTGRWRRSQPFSEDLADLLILQRDDFRRMMNEGDKVLQTVADRPQGLENLVHGLYRYTFKLGQPIGDDFMMADGSAGAGFTAFIGGNTQEEDDQTDLHGLPTGGRRRPAGVRGAGRMRVSKTMLVKVIVFTVICLAFTVALGVKLANSRLFADTYDMRAEFEDATGVMKGDAVKIAGVDVGRVTGTEIKDGKAVLSFNIDKGIQLPTDSEVAIRWRNVLGQRFLYLYPGDDAEVWDEGDTVPLSHTNDVADIGEFLNRVGPILKAIDPEQANAFLDAVNTALASNEDNVRALLDAGASLASDLSERDGHIARTIGNADTIMEAFASQDDQIASIIDNLDDVSGVLARRTDDVNQLVTNFADVQDQLDELLATSSSNIDATIGSLDSVTSTLSSNQEEPGPHAAFDTGRGVELLPDNEHGANGSTCASSSSFSRMAKATTSSVNARTRTCSVARTAVGETRAAPSRSRGTTTAAPPPGMTPVRVRRARTSAHCCATPSRGTSDEAPRRPL